ncbi:MAG: hypothetical protein ACLFTB_01030 [Desulfovibrionales bacterium]
MSLNDDLSQVKTNLMNDSSVGEDVKQALAQFGKHLKDLGLEENAVKQGEIMPAFSLPSADGGSVSLTEILARGPAVVVFFRGRW